MLKPVTQILYNKRLQYWAYFYLTNNQMLLPSNVNDCKFALSLLPTIQTPVSSISFFAFTPSDDLFTLHKGAIENKAFINFMQETIKDSSNELLYLLGSRAKRQREGWLALVDERAPFTFGRTPDCDDTIGMCHVNDGQVNVNSYEPMPMYRLISPLGIFSLPKPLHQAIISKLQQAPPQ